uniref:Uncharacterized protein n=1 Tax=Strongyloides papillosus TaxID=174720 RepID=A0A0N5BD34_STREA
MSNIVEIFAWIYDVKINVYPECYPRYYNEQVFLNLTVFSKSYGTSPGGCNTVRGVSARIPTNIDFQNEGILSIIYKQHENEETLTKKIFKDCKRWSSTGKQFFCDFSNIDPLYDRQLKLIFKNKILENKFFDY